MCAYTVCVHACMPVCAYIVVCVHIHACVHVHVCGLCIYVHLYECVHACLCVHILCVHLHVCVCVGVHACVCTCVHMYMCGSGWLPAKPGKEWEREGLPPHVPLVTARLSHWGSPALHRLQLGLTQGCVSHSVLPGSTSPYRRAVCWLSLVQWGQGSPPCSPLSLGSCQRWRGP